jgi:DNA gyrase subunit A
MKLAKDDEVTDIYVMGAQNISSIMYRKKKLEFGKLKLAKRDTKGSKIRR